MLLLLGQTCLQGFRDARSRGTLLGVLAGADRKEVDHALVGRIQFLHVEGWAGSQCRVIRFLIKAVFIK